MSFEVDANGNDLPVLDPTWNVDSDLVYAVRSRALTWEGQEFFDPNFGFEFARQDEGLTQRMRRSLAEVAGWASGQIEFTQVGSLLDFKVRMEEQ